jgi:ribosomal protein S18 acetylase RimI-like enzyme
MTNDFVIREIQEDQDFEIFLDLNQKALIAYGELSSESTPDEINQYRQNLCQYIKTKKKNVVHLARIEKPIREPAGFIWSAERDGHEPWVFNPQPAWIYNLWVEPAFRRRGLASNLLHAAINWAKQESFQRIGLHVFGHNLSAIQLYQKMGFRTDYVYLQKDLEKTPQETTPIYQIIKRSPEQPTRDLKEKAFQEFCESAQRFGQPDQATRDERFEGWFSNFDFSKPEMWILDALDENETLIGSLWGYTAQRDLGSKAYFWMQGLHDTSSSQESNIIQALINDLEKRLIHQEILAIRTNIQKPSVQKILEESGFHPSNVFMSHDAAQKG